MIDMDNLMKGEDYSKLKESFVIFICTDDPFEKNRPQYSFENLCLEDSEVELDDKVHKLIYNVIKNYILVIFETEFFKKNSQLYCAKFIEPPSLADNSKKRSVEFVKQTRTEYAKRIP